MSLDPNAAGTASPGFPASDRIPAELRQKMRETIAAHAGSEVLFVCDADEDGKVETVRDIAHGARGSVPAPRKQIDPGQVMIHNHPSGRLIPSEADVSVASQLAEEGIACWIVDNQVERLYIITEPYAPPPKVLLNQKDLSSILEPGGALSKRFTDYQARASQIAMLRLVSRAFNDDLLAAIEAGTGVGKTFAYLLPSAAWAVANKERVVVSTATINLQQQIMDKDIPLVSKLIGKPVKAVLAKGRGNYVCTKRLAEALDEDSLLREEDSELSRIAAWAKETKDGSKSDLAFIPADLTWSRINADADACSTQSCALREQCFFFKARREAASAQIVVANHHLLFADAAMRAQGLGFENNVVLPAFKRLVLDEAHNIENNAVDYFSQTLNKWMVSKYLNLLFRRRRGQLFGALAQVLSKVKRPAMPRAPGTPLSGARAQTSTGSTENDPDAGNRKPTPDAVFGGSIPPELAAAMAGLESGGSLPAGDSGIAEDGAASKTKKGAKSGKGASRGATTGKTGSGKTSGKKAKQADPFSVDALESQIHEIRDAARVVDELALSLTSDSGHLRLLATMKGMLIPFTDALAVLQRNILALVENLETLIQNIDDEKPAAEIPGLLDLQGLVRRLGAIASTCETLRNYEAEQERVIWIERQRMPNGETFAHCIACPLDIAPLLRESVFTPYPSVVMTSATLTVDKRFDFWARRLGLIGKAIDKTKDKKTFPHEAAENDFERDGADGGRDADEFGDRESDEWSGYDSGASYDGDPAEYDIPEQYYDDDLPSGRRPSDDDVAADDPDEILERTENLHLPFVDRDMIRAQLPSPFDYPHRVLLAVPRDAPEPSAYGYQDYLNRFVYRAMEISGGHALVLFTSYDMLKQTWEAVAPKLSELGIPAFRQGEAERSKLLARFNAEITSVLFATESFWEGVDSPGETLQLVILCRLPFKVPSEPLQLARSEAIQARNGNPFMELSVPEAIMKFRQGFGRLMRRDSDFGAVLVPDNRIVSKPYGRMFLDSLPPVNQLFGTSRQVMDGLAHFLAQHRNVAKE